MVGRVRNYWTSMGHKRECKDTKCYGLTVRNFETAASSCIPLLISPSSTILI